MGSLHVGKEFGINLSRKATKEVLEAEKVAAAADKIESGQFSDKDLKGLTKKPKTADAALESLLNGRVHKDARAAAMDLCSQLGDKLYNDELKSSTLVDRQKRVIETILEKSNYYRMS